jgi:hypothetical protein
MKNLLLTICLAFTLSLLQAQLARTGGVVQDQDRNPVSGAKVELKGAKSFGAITNDEGRFRISNVEPGAYQMIVSSVAYDTLSKKVEIAAPFTRIGVISLSPRSFQLDQVNIESDVSQAQQKGDTTQYNAGAFKTNPDATAEDLIQKMPGVVVDNGTVQAQGEDVKQVLVDGKPFFGNDPSSALRNLPAEVIDKIEVFDQQSEQSQFTGVDDGETTKTINIVTRTNMRNGQFGNVYAGYGYEDRYKGGGSINHFDNDRRLTILAQANNINQQNFAAEDLTGIVSSGRRGRGRGRGGRGGGSGGDASNFLVNQQGGISTTKAFGLNYSDKWGKKTSLTGSYFFNQSDNVSLEDLNRVFILDADSGQTYVEKSLANSQNINHRFNLRLELEFTPTTSLLIIPSLTIQQNEGVDSTFGYNSFEGFRLNDADNAFSSQLSAVNFSNMFLFRHRFEKRGRTISANIRTGYNQNSGESNLFSALNFYSAPASFDTLNQLSSLFGNGWNISSRVRYTEPISRRGMLQVNYSFSPQWNASDKETYDFLKETGQYSQLDSTLSNTFDNVYYSHQAGAGLMLRSEKLMMMARVSGQWAFLDNQQVFPFADQIDRRFVNVLPFAMLRYRVSRQKSLRFMYRTSASPPSVSQLQEVLDNSNPLQLSSGNQDLDQNYQHSVSLRYNVTNTEKSSVFFFLISGTFTQNYVGNSTVIASRETILENGVVLPRGSQFTQPVNLDGYWQTRSFITYGIPIKPIKTNININLSANYGRIPGLINGEKNETTNGTAGVGIVLSSNISENFDFTVSSRSNFSQGVNSLQPALNTTYFNQNSSVKLNLIFLKGIVLRSQLTSQVYRGLSDGFNQDFWLWNAGIAKKLFKDQRGEIQLSVFDALMQNNSITRNVTETYIEDLQTVVLQRYLMATFTYNIRNFKADEKSSGRGR